MNKEPPELKRLQVIIRKDVLDSLRDFTYSKYGKLHSVLAIEVEQAILEYLDNRATHSHDTRNTKVHKEDDEESEKKPDVTSNNSLMYSESNISNTRGFGNNGHKPAPAILGEMVDFFETMEIGNTTPLYPATIEKYISKHIGADKRTIRKYMNLVKPFTKEGDDMQIFLNINKMKAEWGLSE